MASYTESLLLPGERIKYQARLHMLPFIPAYLLGGALAVAGIFGLGFEVWWLAIAGFGLAIPILAWTYISQTTSEFSRQVQAQISSVDDRGRVAIPEGASTPGGIAQSVNARDERECPYCAELILKKAKVCKHCQRDVEALKA